ncbi:MAG TPA: MFS transporter [Caulobacteraceae bacterium]|nr:MFS transporter [Caulobacteraceae bacterium]
MTAQVEAAPTTTAAAGPSLYAWWVVFVLTLTQALAFVDRQVLALLVEPIKRDLGVSDTAISLLYGLSFALFYVIVALPIAHLADRTNRRNIIGLAVGFWSLATAACGLARGFPQLLAARLGVGAGEAGLSPSAQSMLADYFPRERLGAALGVFSTGVSIGGGLALIVGGALVQAAPALGAALLPFWPGVQPWRIVLVTVGLAGLPIALLFLTVREPVRRGAGAAKPMPFSDVLAYIGRHGWTYFGLIGALAMMIFVAQSSSAWIPAFFARRFGWDAPHIGATYGPLVLICGGSGALIGGLFASMLRSRRIPRANLAASLGGFVLAAPLAIGFPLAGDPRSALVMIGAMTFCAGLTFGGGYAALQEVTPPRMRAQVTALNGLAVNLIGAGLGPLSVALVSDRLFHDPARLHQAIALVAAVASPITVALFLIAMRRHESAAQAVVA